jgi:hypothetical protein
MVARRMDIIRSNDGPNAVLFGRGTRPMLSMVVERNLFDLTMF